MERYYCVDCHGRLFWYDAYILGRSRCAICQEAHELCDALDREAAMREAAANGIADEAIIEQQMTVPLRIQRALEELTSPFAEFGLTDDDMDASPQTPPWPLQPHTQPHTHRQPLEQQRHLVKLQPALLEIVGGGRVDCHRCGALAILIRLRHGPACDDPLLYEYRALCQSCWQTEQADTGYGEGEHAG